MSEIVSAATGYWDVGSTWVGGVVPTTPNTARVNTTAGHQVTIRTAVTIGDGTAGSIAIDIGPTGQNTDACLIGVAGGVLTLQGDLVVRGYTNTVAKKRIDFQAGFQVIFDGTTSSRFIKFGDNAANDAPHIRIVGASGARVEFSQIGTNPCRFAPGDAGGFFSYTLDYMRCTGLLGDPCFETAYSLGVSAGYTGFDATMGRHVEWVGCGLVRMNFAPALHADAPWNLSGTFRDSIASGGSCVNFGIGAARGATVKNLIVNTGCIVDTNGLVENHDNFLMKTNAFGSTSASDATVHVNNIWVMDGQSGEDGNTEVPMVDTGDLTDCFLLFTRKCLHNYYFSWDVLRPRTFTRVIFEQRALTTAGGGCLGPATSPASPMTFRLRECIGVRNVRADGISVGGWCIEMGAGVNATLDEEHCTKYVGGAATGNGAGDFTLGSGLVAGGGGYADQCQSYRYNIAYTRATGEGYKILSAPAATGPTNWVSDANANYNCGFGLAAGTLGKGYEFPVSGAGYGAPGANDITADPGFVDDTRNFIEYAHSVDSSIPLIGASATDAEEDAAMDAAIALWMSQNDDAPAFTVSVAALNARVQAGYTPTNAALNATAGHGTMGAMPFAASGPSVNKAAYYREAYAL